MANFHKHGYHGDAMGKYETKKNLLKGVKHENQKIPLALSFSHGFIIKG